MLAGADQDRRHVAVTRGDSTAMIDFDQIAVAAAVPACTKHGAVGRRIDRRTISAGQIDARVHGGPVVERVGPESVSGHQDDVGPDRLIRGNGDHSVLQLVELLPAVEQSLEGRIAGALEWAALAAVARLCGVEAEAAKRGLVDVLALKRGSKRE